MIKATELKSSNLKALIVFMVSAFFLGFTQNYYDYTFKSKKCIISYSFGLKNDSTFMIGRVTEKKTQDPVANINILMAEHGIRTVSNLNGEFKIYLPEQDGIILFDKIGDVKFEMNYQISSKTLIDLKELNEDYSHH